MKYLPFEDFEIHTRLTSDEFYYRLCAAVDTERKWLIFTNKPFWGEVNRHYFKIWRTNRWRRDDPVVTGTIVSEGLGCCIFVRMRLPWLSFLFNSLFFGFVWLALFISPAEWLVKKIQTGSWQVESPGGYLLAIVIFALFNLISAGIFRNDVQQLKADLLWISQTKAEDVIHKDRIWGIRETQIIKALFIISLVVALGWIVFKLFQ